MARFKAAQIDARVFFWPLSMMPMFEAKPQNKISYALYSRGLNLPSYHDMHHNDIVRVAAVLRQALTEGCSA